MEDIMEDIQVEIAKLVVDGWRFHSNYGSEEAINEAFRLLTNILPMDIQMMEKPFRVNITNLNPNTREVTKWTKVEGWSLWTRA